MQYLHIISIITQDSLKDILVAVVVKLAKWKSGPVYVVIGKDPLPLLRRIISITYYEA